ncbi:hypothetical protein CRYUN_Cryun12cG0099300 [Craigia yunnanensis]
MSLLGRCFGRGLESVRANVQWCVFGRAHLGGMGKYLLGTGNEFTVIDLNENPEEKSFPNLILLACIVEATKLRYIHKGSKMDNCGDFIQLLGPDMSMKIHMHLDNPADLVRDCLVSGSWCQFVIAMGLCKKLCLKLFPEISGVVHTIEVNNLIDPNYVYISAYVQYGIPIYSSKAVGFRLGHTRLLEELQSDTTDSSTSRHRLADNEFIWTYIIPEFPMAQCIPCSNCWAVPRFDIKILDATGRCALKYLPETENCMLSPGSPKGDNGASSRFRTLQD